MYWRVPVTMTAAEMRQRANIVQKYTSSETQSDDNEDDFDRLLVCNSENEDNSEEINETIRDDMNKVIHNQRNDNDYGTQPIANENSKKKETNESPETEIAGADEAEINTEAIRFRLNELLDSDDSDVSTHIEATASFVKNVVGMKRRRIQAFESDSDMDDDTGNIANTQAKENYMNTNTTSAISAKKKKAIESDDEM